MLPLLLLLLPHLQVQSRSRGTLSLSPPGGSKSAARASSPTTLPLLCWPPSSHTALQRPASQAGLTARWVEKS